MRRLLLLSAFGVGAVGLLIGWSTTRPPVPDYVPLGDTVELGFEVTGLEGEALEIGLRQGQGTLFMRFDIEMEGAHAVAVLNGAGARRTMRGRGQQQALPDWPFLKGRDGEPVLEFSFENQLVEVEGGKLAVRMVYTGRDVPLLAAVRVARPTTLPPFLGERLGHDGPVRLEPGTYPVDAEVGVMIDAEKLGRRGPRERQ